MGGTLENICILQLSKLPTEARNNLQMTMKKSAAMTPKTTDTRKYMKKHSPMNSSIIICDCKKCSVEFCTPFACHQSIIPKLQMQRYKHTLLGTGKNWSITEVLDSVLW
jgi:hypothetical protein